MAYWLDLLGSYIIGGAVLLLIAGLNFYISSSSSQTVFSNIAQSNLSSTVDVVTHDFYKIGYRVTGNKITVADSNQIKFYSDLADNGVEDSLDYYTGSTSQLSSTTNPDDKLLYRVVNSQTALSSMAVTNFKLTYYDSLGSKINYGSLNSQNHRDKIRSIQIYLKVESGEPIDGAYQAAEWQEKITPKNLSITASSGNNGNGNGNGNGGGSGGGSGSGGSGSGGSGNGHGHDDGHHHH